MADYNFFLLAGAQLEIERLDCARYHGTAAFVIVRGLQMAGRRQHSGNVKPDRLTGGVGIVTC